MRRIGVEILLTCEQCEHVHVISIHVFNWVNAIRCLVSSRVDERTEASSNRRMQRWVERSDQKRPRKQQNHPPESGFSVLSAIDTWVDLKCTHFGNIQEAETAPPFTCRQCEKITTIQAERVAMMKEHAERCTSRMDELTAKLDREIA